MATVAELREQLIAGGMAEETANEIKGKANLEQALLELNQAASDIDALENVALESDDSPEIVAEPDDVMSLFRDDELAEGKQGDKHPRLHGLRRVVKEHFPNITFSGPVEIQVFSGGMICRYAVRAGIQEFMAAADATSRNVNEGYDIYLTAIAESRAEARVYRKMLGIQVAAAEEICGVQTKEYQPYDSVLGANDEDEASDQQIAAIKKLCDKFQVPAAEYLKDSMTRAQAKEIINELSAKQRG